MKFIYTTLFHSAILTTQLFSTETNQLEDACCYIVISPDRISTLDHWNHSKKDCIGFDHSNIAIRNPLMEISNAEKFVNLAEITFENEEILIPQNGLIAEISCVKPIQECTEDDLKSMGASRKRG